MTPAAALGFCPTSGHFSRAVSPSHLRSRSSCSDISLFLQTPLPAGGGQGRATPLVERDGPVVSGAAIGMEPQVLGPDHRPRAASVPVLWLRVQPPRFYRLLKPLRPASLRAGRRGRRPEGDCVHLDLRRPS